MKEKEIKKERNKRKEGRKKRKGINNIPFCVDSGKFLQLKQA